MTEALVVVALVGVVVVGVVLFAAGMDVHRREARQVDELIRANRAKARPGMATRDDRLLEEMAKRRRS